MLFLEFFGWISLSERAVRMDWESPSSQSSGHVSVVLASRFAVDQDGRFLLLMISLKWPALMPTFLAIFICIPCFIFAP